MLVVAETELARVLFEYGEERHSRRIARAIVRARAEKPITRTRELAEIVAQAHPAWERHKHPATRAFQATLRVPFSLRRPTIDYLGAVLLAATASRVDHWILVEATGWSHGKGWEQRMGKPWIEDPAAAPGPTIAVSTPLRYFPIHSWMVSTAKRLATSPAACPPIPSATT